MFLYFYFLFSVVSQGITASENALDNSLKIAGGEPADIKDHPYQVAIVLDGSLCGGAILTRNYILTAAHCTDGKDTSIIEIRAGSNYFYKNGVVVYADEIIPHPQFDAENIDYDIAIIRLKTPLNYGDTIKSISLPPENEPIESYRLATVTGYGIISEDGPVSKSLQKVDLPLISTEDCMEIYGEDQITQRMFCAGYVAGGKDACKGDSGGPMVLDGELIGIVSFGPSCALPGTPTAFAKVSSMIDFINSVIKR